MERGERGGTVPARMYSSSLPVNCGAAPRQVVAAVVVVLVDLAVALTLRLPPLPLSAPLYICRCFSVSVARLSIQLSWATALSWRRLFD